MAKFFKKQKGRSAGSCQYTKDDMKRADWCMTKDIYVAVIPHWDGGPADWNPDNFLLRGSFFAIFLIFESRHRALQQPKISRSWPTNSRNGIC